MAAIKHLSPASKVWIYQSSREFTPEETKQLKEVVAKFADAWVSHQVQVDAHGDILYNRFILFVVDETKTGVGGCSIDASYRFIREVENAFKINLFDRLNIAYREKEGIATIHRNDVEVALKEGKLTEDTIIFNNMVTTKAEFENSWQVPLKDSWVMQLV